MIIQAVVGVILFSTGLLLGVIFASDEATRTTNRGCYICIKGTGDPNIYRAVYTLHGSVRHNVTGRGITNTLQNMIDEIEP